MSRNGKLSEAQQLLLQKYPSLSSDDPLVELAAWNASLEVKVENFGENLSAWTKAILKQIDLSSSQNQLIVEMGGSLKDAAKISAELGEALEQLNQEFEILKSEFLKLKNTCESQEKAVKQLQRSTESLNEKITSIKVELSKISHSILDQVESTSDKIDLMNAKMSAEKRLNFSRFTTLLALVVGAIGWIGWWGYSLQSQIQKVNGNVNNAIIKIQQSAE